MGFIFFGVTMYLVADVFNLSFTFQCYINEKNMAFNLWMKRLEKSNQPYYMSNYLYEDA